MKAEREKSGKKQPTRSRARELKVRAFVVFLATLAVSLATLGAALSLPARGGVAHDYPAIHSPSGPPAHAAPPVQANSTSREALRTSSASLNSAAGLRSRAPSLHQTKGTRAELLSTDNQDIGFTGYVKDVESGLYYAKARYYDPRVARFITHDPEEGNPMQPPSLHRYLYAYANPTVYSDPSGREACLGQAVENCPLAQWTPNNRPVSQTVASDALKGLPQLDEVDADLTHALPSTPLGPKEHLFTDEYRLVPYVKPNDETKAVRYYSAQNLQTHNFDWTVPPQQLDTFIANESTMANFAAFSRGFGGTTDYNIATQRALRDELDGNLAGAASNLASSWTSAVSDPDWWAQTATSYAGGALAKANMEGRALTAVENHNGSTSLRLTQDSSVSDIRARVMANVEESRIGNATSDFDVHAANDYAISAVRSVGDLRRAGLKDAHHIIQDAAVKDLPQYSTQEAPGLQLEGPANRVGTEHHAATQAQRQGGGGNFGAERLVAFRALRAAGYSELQAQAIVERAGQYFKQIGVDSSTFTRTPGNRK